MKVFMVKLESVKEMLFQALLLDDGTYEVLDGNHRLFRAVQERKLYIMAHILSETEMEKYIMN